MSISRPAKLLQLPFANNSAQRNNVPVDSASPLASYHDGFPVVNMLPITAGGVPPEGQDFNGILYDITGHTVWVNAGGQYVFDAALAAAIGGYPVGIVLQNNAGTASYVNVSAANSTDFNSSPSSIGVTWMPWGGAALQLQGTAWCGTSTGSANAQILTPVPALGAYAAGQAISFKVGAGLTNTGALTLNISGLGVIHVLKDSPTGPIELTGGEGVAGNILTARSDGTYFQLTATDLGTASLLNASDQLGTVGAIQVYSGNPNTHVAGNAGVVGTLAPSIVWDTSGWAFWICTTTGNAAAAVWQRNAGAPGRSPPAYIDVSTAGTVIQPGVYLADTFGGAFNRLLPASPSIGDAIEFRDIHPYWHVNALTLNRNGNTIMGNAEDLVCNMAALVFTIWYDGSTWRLS